MSIPQSWFRSATDPFNKEDQKLRGNVDSRFPMIVLSGLPGVGKTVIARELANILEESDRSLVPGNEKRMTLVETAWSFFQDPRPRSRPGSHDAGHPGCMRDTYSGPVEHFAGGKAIVVNVDHLSCEQSIQEREQRERRADTRRGDGFGSTRATTEVSEKPLSKADKEIAGSLSWYCTSLASLDPSRNHDPETIRCLDKGRRLALEKYIMPEQNNNSTAIFTECLFQDDRNGASEYAAKAYKTAADVFERRLIPIYLTCDAKEHQRRFGCRETEMRQKLIASESQKAIGLLTPSEAEVLARGNIDSIEAMLKNVTNKGEDVLYYFSKPADYKDDKYFLPKEVGPTGELGSPQMPENYQGCRIDTTGLTPLEVAGIIQKFCEDVMRGKAGQTLVSWGVHLWPELEEEDKKDGGNKKLEKKGISKDWQMVAPLNGEPAE
ncbi:hypothetical protein SEUCBS139899_005150 [Sporothrix eucalyptigena]|uniref:Uncharacterized protein n=1 Tax=Sporothrix eucalyptigena TaxID=1812306 RepID=A0ABP0AJQ7_9PEZI